jgi:hypothetical protein
VWPQHLVVGSLGHAYTIPKHGFATFGPAPLGDGQRSDQADSYISDVGEVPREIAAENCSDHFSLHYHILSLLASLGRDCCRFVRLLPLFAALLQQLLPAVCCCGQTMWASICIKLFLLEQ